MPIKRLNYFDHQFLVEADFTDQQQYHLDTHRRLARLLSTAGIGEGLEVVKSAAKAVTIRPGAAIDRDGRTMIVEANRVIDLSGTQFTPGATVFITLTYQEQQTDPSTATGAPGMTRVTEQPIAQAVIVAPPTDGTVIRLARFVLDSAGNVPGNVDAILDGGVRVLIGPKGERGLASIEGVTSPGGNVDLVAGPGISITSNQTVRNITIGASGLGSLDGVSSPGGNIDLVGAQAVTVTPDVTNKRITIGETHSTLTGNPHGLQATDIGALLASDYDLRRRAVVSVLFNHAPPSPVLGQVTSRTVAVPFQARLASMVGICNVSLGSKVHTGVITAFADFVNGPSFIHSSVGAGRSATEALIDVRSGASFVCDILFFSVPDQQGELLQVQLSNVSASGFTVTLTRGPVFGIPNPLPRFFMTLTFMCMG
jgi:hypothetical protein